MHRDIHEGNILLGPKGAPVGWRGVLIDLGVAIDVYGLRKAIVREARTVSYPLTSPVQAPLIINSRALASSNPVPSSIS